MRKLRAILCAVVSGASCLCMNHNANVHKIVRRRLVCTSLDGNDKCSFSIRTTTVCIEQNDLQFSNNECSWPGFMRAVQKERSVNRRLRTESGQQTNGREGDGKLGGGRGDGGISFQLAGLMIRRKKKKNTRSPVNSSRRDLVARCGIFCVIA